MLQVSKWKLILALAVSFSAIYFSLPTFIHPTANSFLERFLPNKRVNLGLDLRGGAYILLDVDMNSYQKEQNNTSIEQIRIKLREQKITASNFQILNNQIIFSVTDHSDINKAIQAVQSALGLLFKVETNDTQITITPDDSYIKNMKNEMMAQTIEIVRRRIDESGTKEVDIQRQGDNYILVQVPGADNPEEIKNLLGKTAKMTFHVVADQSITQAAMQGTLPLGYKILPLEEKDAARKTLVVIESRALLSGEHLVDAQAGVDEYSRPVVNFKFNSIGAKIFGDISTQNVGRQLAIVLDNKVISAPNINEPILGGSGRISGSFTILEANELALLLRAGALPVPLHVAEERTVGPSLGSDSIEAGSKAAIIGTSLVVVFMFIFYGKFGMFANFALVINLLMIISLLTLFDATLTLPGIAGMVLTLGMAVDANVLIFERIKEEARKGRSPLSAIESGFQFAFATIVDSNFTTILASSILFFLGTGPIKGFAITLIIGISCSMFTAITLTRLMLALWYRKNMPKTLPL
ncbi:MAG: protein translocase subunit SecD [Rickettsiales bacterium]